jgi:hypothetical protein
MTVYYIPPYDGVSKVTAFRPVRESLPVTIMYTQPDIRASVCLLATPYSAIQLASHLVSATAASTKTQTPSVAHPVLMETLRIFQRGCVRAVSVRKSRFPHAGMASILTHQITRVTWRTLRSRTNPMHLQWDPRIGESVHKAILFICHKSCMRSCSILRRSTGRSFGVRTVRNHLCTPWATRKSFISTAPQLVDMENHIAD